MRAIVVALVLAVLPACGQPPEVAPDTQGLIVRTAGPARMMFDLNTRVITITNIGNAPIGVEMSDYYDQSIGVWTDYYISGYDTESSPALSILRLDLTVHTDLVVYSGKVTGALAAAGTWTGVSLFTKLAQDAVVDEYHDNFTIK